GIEVKETTSPDAGDYHSMLILRVKANGKTHYVEGTLYGKKEPRFVRVDEFPVEIIPEGTMLYIYNQDRPGVIGNIGSALGKNNINIARMHFGRQAPGGMAISVVSVDQDVPEDVLNEIKALPNIVDVKVVRL
ncbi:MAG: ACT domain-containing protein, partial [Nitrospirae bacterium]